MVVVVVVEEEVEEGETCWQIVARRLRAMFLFILRNLFEELYFSNSKPTERF